MRNDHAQQVEHLRAEIAKRDAEIERLNTEAAEVRREVEKSVRELAEQNAALTLRAQQRQAPPCVPIGNESDGEYKYEQSGGGW